MKISVFWNVVPSGLKNGHHHLEEPAACIFRADIKLFEENDVDIGEIGPLTAIFSHLTLAFPGLSVQFMLLCISPLPSV
jgi:hypothetical protein